MRIKSIKLGLIGKATEEEKKIEAMRELQRKNKELLDKQLKELELALASAR